jgi:glycosyltransferase involved in cell wall biosynthesis
VPPVQALWRLPRLLFRLQPDVLQSWMYNSNIVGACSRWSLPRRARLYWGIRQSLYDLAYERSHTARVIRISRFFATAPDAIIYNATLSAAQHEQTLGYPVAKRVVIGNGFDTDRFRPQPGAGEALRTTLNIAAGTPVVGLAARFDPLKDHRNFLRAAAIARRVFPALIVVLAGPGVTFDNSELRDLIRGLELDDAVRLMGPVSDMPSFYGVLDVAVSSSLSEGFPNTVGEAMACGVPCVVTNVGECAALVGGVGSVVPPRDSEALAQAIVQMLQLSPTERLSLGGSARGRVIENYSIASVASQYAQLYRSDA